MLDKYRPCSDKRSARSTRRSFLVSAGVLWFQPQFKEASFIDQKRKKQWEEREKNSQRALFNQTWNMSLNLSTCSWKQIHTHTHKYGTAVRSQICMRISVSDMGAFNNSEQSWGRILDVLWGYCPQGDAEGQMQLWSSETAFSIVGGKKKINALSSD